MEGVEVSRHVGQGSQTVGVEVLVLRENHTETQRVTTCHPLLAPPPFHLNREGLSNEKQTCNAMLQRIKGLD